MGNGIPPTMKALPPRTGHHTYFRNCTMNLVKDENNMWVLQIVDPFANHVYEFQFGDEIKTQIVHTLTGVSIPNIHVEHKPDA